MAGEINENIKHDHFAIRRKLPKIKCDLIHIL